MKLLASKSNKVTLLTMKGEDDDWYDDHNTVGK